MLSTIQPYGYSPSIEQSAAGVDLGGTIAVPTGGRTFFVRGNGTSVTQYADDQVDIYRQANQGMVFPSVAVALTKCVSGRGDRIFVLPGHTENLPTAAAWTFVNDVAILGIGHGNSRPTFTFTAAGSTLVVNKKNVFFGNLRFLCAGPAGTTALTVAAPFAISGEGFMASGCYFQIGIDADQLCTDFCNVTGANCTFAYCDIVSAAQTAAPTSCIKLTGANGFRFVGNFCKSAFAAAGTGFIANTTTAAADIRIEDNFLQQWKSDSTAVMTFAANSVTTGIIRRNLMRLMTDGAVAPITLSGTGVDITLLDNFTVNAPNERGLVFGTASS